MVIISALAGTSQEAPPLRWWEYVTSYRNVKGAAHPVNVFSTINIDINTGSEITLNDIVVIDEDFLAKVRAGEFIAVSPRVKDIITFSDEELMRACNQEGSFYFTEDSLGIKVTVPHVAGDYVIFEVKYRDIADNIKGENPVWQSLFPERAGDDGCRQ